LKTDPKKAVNEKLDEIRKETKETIDAWLKDGKKFATDLKKNPKKTVNDMVKEGKEKVGDVRKDARETFEDWVDEGKKFFKGVKGDARKGFDEIIDTGKKIFPKTEVVEKMEKKINKGLSSVAQRMNIPAKSDIDQLISAMDNLDKKVNALNQKNKAA
jgi:polyhydroxyalkanoate synthesis regulator phasin